MECTIKGNTVDFTFITEDDAEFILALRKDTRLGQFLSTTDISVDQQKEWIRNYKIREAQNLEYYFCIRYESKAYGVVRLYNIDYSKKECAFGSFIIHPSRPSGTSIQAIEFALAFAFNDLDLDSVILDVRKQNKKAIRLYEYCGFKKYDETDMDILYKINKKN